MESDASVKKIMRLGFHVAKQPMILVVQNMLDVIRIIVVVAVHFADAQEVSVETPSVQEGTESSLELEEKYNWTS